MIYLAVFAFSVFMLYCSEKTKKRLNRRLYILLALLVPSVLAGLRDYTIGADVLNYGNIWFERAHIATTLTDFLKSANRQSVGIGYALLNYLVGRFTENSHWFYFVLSLLEMSLLYLAVKRYKKNIGLVLSFIVFFFFYYNESYNMLRQMVALLIVLNSFQFIIERKLIKFLLVVICASLFHVTAIISIVLYPLSLLSESKLRKVYYWLIGAGLMGVIVGFSNIVSFFASKGIISGDRFSFYTEGDGVTGGRIIRLVFFALMFVVFTIKKKKIEKRFKYTNTLYVYCIFSLGLTALVFLYTNSFIIRVAYYFDIFMILYVPLIAKSLNIQYGKKRALTQGSIITIYYFVYWLIVYVIRNGAGTVPYKFMGM